MNRNVEQEGREVVKAASGGALVSMLGKLGYLVTRVALPPIVLRHVGLEEYGLWALAFVLIGYLGMGAFGVSNVYIRYVAAYRARGDVDAINRLLSTGLAFTSTIALVLLVALAATMPTLLDLLGVADHLKPRASTILFAASAAFLVDLAFGAFSNMLLGLERVTAHTVVWVGGSAFEALVLVVLLEGGHGVEALPAAFALRLLSGIVASAVLCRRALPGLRVSPRFFDRAALRLFLGYGGVVQVAGLLGIFLYSVEKLVAAVFLGPAAAGLFDVGEKFAVMVSGIPASLNGVLLAPVARLGAASTSSSAAAFFLTASRWVCLPAGVLMAFLAAFAPSVITAWMGPDPRFTEAAFILTVFSVAFHLHVVTGPASAWYRGIAEPARELFYPLVQMLLVAVFVATGFAAFGRSVEVVAVTVASAMVVSALAYSAWTSRRMGVAASKLATHVVLPGLAPYLVAAASRWVVESLLGAGVDGRADAVAVLLAGGVVYGVAVSILLWTTILDAGEKESCRLAAARLLPSSRAGFPVLQAAGGGES